MISNGDLELFRVVALDFPYGKRTFKMNILYKSPYQNSDMEAHNNKKSRTS